MFCAKIEDINKWVAPYMKFQFLVEPVSVYNCHYVITIELDWQFHNAVHGTYCRLHIYTGTVALQNLYCTFDFLMKNYALMICAGYYIQYSCTMNRD